jgi:hypothetical protein
MVAVNINVMVFWKVIPCSMAAGTNIFFSFAAFVP